ncbi:kinesin-like protein KIN-10A [Coffea arabica]|uniref:Kinesin-like protein KIN-10A n=1 Tax=Coffea arabica TaxID=13443 RepID=A0A6P6WME6_COFAR|nr:kinesin-like protein KIN-10A [Coffea arabica]
MAPTPSSKPHSMMQTPSSKSNPAHNQTRTPQSKQRLNFNVSKPSPNHNSSAMAKESNNPPAEHPVEVIGRIRDYPDQKKNPASSSALQINPDKQSLRVKTEIGYRDFSLDGVSLSEEEDLDAFYKKFVESRINGVKLGDKCTIMMYGPTGAGKSHTMFGCGKQPGIVYKSLKDILGEGEEVGEENGEKLGPATFVQVTVLEIYNEEIYDLLSTNNGGGFNLGWAKGGSASKVRLEVMGKKAKNASFIAGHEATKISREIQKVEKRRIVKSTLCNERSSRSHCMIILDVPTVGGRLMLVDMAGSENIEQAGQNGLEAKLQTAKINQGNTALKRVVESIANGDSHVPFRDSKLTMLLQDSFEDDKSKILMILCASPDPKELHKTISTLEYGAKAKCIVRGPHTPIKERGAEDSSSAVILGSRIAAMDQFIYKLQMENKLREKERNDAQKELMKKEEEIAALRAKVSLAEGKGHDTMEEEINLKANQQVQKLKSELEKRIQECEKMADELIEMERRKMENVVLQFQQESEMLRQRLRELESELYKSRVGGGSLDMDGSNFVRKLLDTYSEDSGMVKSMDLDKSYDLDAGKQDVVVFKAGNSETKSYLDFDSRKNSRDDKDYDLLVRSFSSKGCLSTVFEADEEEGSGDDKEKFSDEEVRKEVIEEKVVCSSTLAAKAPSIPVSSPEVSSQNQEKVENFRETLVDKLLQAESPSEPESAQDTASSRLMRIQNIFTLCGNHRELSQHIRTPMPGRKRSENIDPMASPVRTTEEGSDAKSISDVKQLQKSLSKDLLVSDIPENFQTPMGNKKMAPSSFESTLASKENCNPIDEKIGDLDVYVKWEASMENPGKFITTLKVVKDSTLADLRKLIEIHLGGDNQAFTFLVLGDPSGAPVPRETEATMQASKLPICNNQLPGRLACLRPLKGTRNTPHHLPLSPLENKLPLTPISNVTKHCDYPSPELPTHLDSTPFVTLRRY